MNYLSDLAQQFMDNPFQMLFIILSIVIVDNKTNKPIYDSKSLEDVGFFIDKLKVAKRFKIKTV